MTELVSWYSPTSGNRTLIHNSFCVSILAGFATNTFTVDTLLLVDPQPISRLFTLSYCLQSQVSHSSSWCYSTVDEDKVVVHIWHITVLIRNTKELSPHTKSSVLPTCFRMLHFNTPVRKSGAEITGILVRILPVFVLSVKCVRSVHGHTGQLIRNCLCPRF